MIASAYQQLHIQPNHLKKPTKDTTYKEVPMSICQNNYPELTAEEVSYIVSFILPDCEYHQEWLPALMAIHDWSNGDNVGYSICENWCARGTKYDKSVLLTKWRGFKKNGGVNIGKLIAIAKKYGYKHHYINNTSYNYVPSEEISQTKVAEAAEELARKRKAQEVSDQQFNRFLHLYSTASRPAPRNNQYLTKKNVLPHDLREMDITATPNIRSGNNVLVIPMSTFVTFNDSDLLITQSFQFIYPNGDKFYYKGRAVSGCFYIFSGTTTEIYLSEGWATSASLHENTGATVIDCFSCGQLPEVAKNIRKIYPVESYPNTKFVIAADNDKSGLFCGSKAAKLLGARLTYPVFPPNVAGKDFNDLHNYLININKDKHYE